MPTSVQLKREVIKQLGFFPSFLIPAIETPQILESLWQETLNTYINNPLPAIFKEKLFVSLSHRAKIDYFVICHSCTLRSLGITGKEILALEDLTFPHPETDLKLDLQILAQQPVDSDRWSNNLEIEQTILRCSALIFLHNSPTSAYCLPLRKYLGRITYGYLVAFLGYIKLCHQWLKSRANASYF